MWGSKMMPPHFFKFKPLNTPTLFSPLKTLNPFNKRHKLHSRTPYSIAFLALYLNQVNRIKLAKTGLPVWMLGLGADRLRADMNRSLALLFHQGVLDEQFLQLQQLQDESSPNFVSEVVNIYFHESEKLLRNLRGLLTDRELSDYKKMGIHLNQFVGSSSSIGAKRVRDVCVAFRAASEQNNRAGCLRALELLEHEYCYLKNKMHEHFQLEQQRVLVAGVRYPMEN